MDNISIVEAISITFSSMTIVILTLSLIALILGSFKHLFKEESNLDIKKENIDTVLEEDDEEKLIACLAASAMAGDGKVNPNLHIKRVTRIK